MVAFGTSCATDVLECPVPLTLMSSIRICRLGMVKPNSRTYLTIEDILVNKQVIILAAEEWLKVVKGSYLYHCHENH